MEMGNGSEYFKVILYFDIVIFLMALIELPFIDWSSSGFVVLVMVLMINGVTGSAAYIVIRRNRNKYK